MKIPLTTKKPNYYVVLSHTVALSSWKTLEDAKQCLERLRVHQPEDFQRTIGIMETSPTGKKFLGMLLPPKIKGKLLNAEFQCGHCQQIISLKPDAFKFSQSDTGNLGPNAFHGEQEISFACSNCHHKNVVELMSW